METWIMWFIRILILGVAAWLIYSALKSSKKDSGEVNTSNQPAEKVVQCEHCRTHLPEKTAVKHEEHHFCNEEHKQQYLDNKKD